MSASGNQGEPGMILLIVLVLFSILAWVFWQITGAFWIDHVFRWIRFIELFILNLFTHKYGACLDWLRVVPVNNANPSPEVIQLTEACFGVEYLNHIPRDKVPLFYTLSDTSVEAMGLEMARYLRWAFSAGLAVVAGYAILFSPRLKFLTRHTLESLIQTQAKMWPIITPIVKFNPSKSGRILGSKVPDKLPIFGEALSPEEWISFNRIPLVNGVPDRDSVRRAYIQQLGPRWNGDIMGLPVHMRAILAACALKGAQKRDESDTFLGELATFWSPEKGFRPDGEMISKIDKILSDPDLGEMLKPVMDQHAWRTTAILGALRWARNNGGVMAPAQFLWLRAEDRALWYPLNNLGRRAFHSEGAGAMAHFMAETAAKKPLPIPRVDTAVVTLNTYLHDPDKRSISIPPREEP